MPPPGSTPNSLGGTRLIVSNAPSGKVIHWPDPAAELLSAPTVTGLWSPVIGATSPFHIPVTQSNMFYRLLRGSGCANLPEGLVGWWRAEGTASDQSGRNPGSLLGGLGFTTGRVGQAFNFTNDGHGILIPASASLNVGTNEGFTIEGWLYPTDVMQPRPIVEWSAAGGFFVGFHLWIAGTLGLSGGPGSLSASLNGDPDPSVTAISVAGLVKSNGWYHVACIYRAHDPVFGSLKIHLNGQIVAVQSIASPTPSVLTQYPLYLGIRGGSYFYRGLMDEMSLYNLALSDMELKSLYSAGSAGKCVP